jgi:hypothetical protein
MWFTVEPIRGGSRQGGSHTSLGLPGADVIGTEVAMRLPRRQAAVAAAAFAIGAAVLAGCGSQTSSGNNGPAKPAQPASQPSSTPSSSGGGGGGYGY